MQCWGLTDQGCVRKQNQDTYRIEQLDRNTMLCVVCDGMGGAKSGNIASSLAVDVFVEEVRRTWISSMDMDKTSQMLEAAVKLANFTVYDQAMQFEEFDGMGTTLVAALVRGRHATVVNVGDSRAYHLFSSEEDECIRQVTRDHSHVRELIERGEITEEQAKTHPKRNKITRAIGADSSVTPDYFELDMNDGDMLLLCSDGLSSYGDDMDILDICFEVKPEDCTEALVRYANNNGGHDNVSVAFVTL